MEIEDFRFYFGAASGSSRKTLQKMDEPDIMISHHTNNNSPWPCKSLFIDSGGYSLMQKAGEHPPAEEYLSYVKKNVPELWAYQDYPCEPDILKEYNRTVEDHIRLTVDKACENRKLAREMGIESTEVVVLQGWEPTEYIDCLDRLKDHGLVDDETYIGIGSVCGRNARDDIAKIVKTVNNELSPTNKIHAFGVKQDVLRYSEIVEMLDSADSLSYDWDYTMKFPGPRWHQVCYNYMLMKERLADNMCVDTIESDGDRYTTNKKLYIEQLNKVTGYNGNSSSNITKSQISHWAEYFMRHYYSE